MTGASKRFGDLFRTTTEQMGFIVTGRAGRAWQEKTHKDGDTPFVQVFPEV